MVRQKDGTVSVRWDIPSAALSVLQGRADRARRTAAAQIVLDICTMYGIEEWQYDEPLPVVVRVRAENGAIPGNVSASDRHALATSPASDRHSFRAVTSPESATSLNPLPQPSQPSPSAVTASVQNPWAPPNGQAQPPPTPAPDPTNDGLPSWIPDEPISPELQALLDRANQPAPASAPATSPPKAPAQATTAPSEPPQPLTSSGYPPYRHPPMDPERLAEVDPELVKRYKLDQEYRGPSPFDMTAEEYQAAMRENQRAYYRRIGKPMPERTSIFEMELLPDLTPKAPHFGETTNRINDEQAVRRRKERKEREAQQALLAQQGQQGQSST